MVEFKLWDALVLILSKFSTGPAIRVCQKYQAENFRWLYQATISFGDASSYTLKISPSFFTAPIIVASTRVIEIW